MYVFHLLISGPTNKISTENRQSKSVYSAPPLYIHGTGVWSTRFITIFIHAQFVTIHIHTYTYIYLICIEGGWNTMGV